VIDAIREWRRRGDARAYERARLWFDAIGSPERGCQNAYAGTIIQIRQRARTGVKAYVRWEADGSVTGLWVPGASNLPLAPVVVTGSLGWGDHHEEPVVFASTIRRVRRKDIRKGRRHLKRCGPQWSY